MADFALFQGLMAADEKLGKTMFFPLAERMVVKFINENKVDAEAGTVHVLPFLGIIILITCITVIVKPEISINKH